MNKNINQEQGFTLIELSIVLVIIGLIVGGVLVGQDLIKAAQIRATVSQFEKYNTAANTFRSKYNGLPGDLQSATNFFPGVTGATVPGTAGEGDGDRMVQGISAISTPCTANTCISGEAALFWYELAQAALIPDNITTVNYETLTLTPSDSVLPQAKLGGGNRIAVAGFVGTNYFILGNPGTAAAAAGAVSWTAALNPLDASQIDSKIDDGKPDTGTVISTALTSPVGGVVGNTATTAAMTSTACATTLADPTNPNIYATTTMNSNNNTTNKNCILSIRAAF